ncbi:MAG TPA: hypothetical protein VI306_06665 [Pyrinomonadaceae bacterium]
MQEELLSKTKIKSFVTTCRHYTVPPIFLSQYYLAPKSHPVSQQLRGLLAEVAELLLMISDEEVELLLRNLPIGFKMFLDRRPTDNDPRTWIERVALYYIAAQCQQHYFSMTGIVNFRESESVVFQHYPELKDRTDDDGLLRSTKNSSCSMAASSTEIIFCTTINFCVGDTTRIRTTIF